MTRKSDSHARLLVDAIHGDWETGPVSAFATAAAAHARRRRFLRNTLLTVGSTGGIAAALAFALLQRPVPLPAPQKTLSPSCEIISDAELLRLVDRPALLALDSDGRQQLILLEDVR